MKEYKVVVTSRIRLESDLNYWSERGWSYCDFVIVGGSDALIVERELK